MKIKRKERAKKQITIIKDSYINGILQKVAHYIRTELFLDNGTKIVLGVSGGIDSVAMLDILHLLTESFQFQLVVAHYNHNLRGKNSDEDEKFVKELSEQYGLEFYHSKGRVRQYAQKNSLSIEQSARVLRYLFFQRVAIASESPFIATAHTRDDVAETFLMNLIRGSGLTGLSSIPPRRSLNKKITVVRPIIILYKEELIEYCNKRGLNWREDESNVMLNYTRNRIRHILLPLIKEQFNPNIIDVLNRTSKLLASADIMIQEYIERYIQNLIEVFDSNTVGLKLQLLRTYNEFLQGEIINNLLNKYFQLPYINQNIIQSLCNLIDNSVGAIFWLNSKLFAVRDRDFLIFARKKDVEKVNVLIEKTGKYQINNKIIHLKKMNKKNIKFDNNPNIEYFDYDLIPHTLTIRNWQSGDSFIPLGMDGSVKISDFLTNIKISPLDKPKVLVLVAKDEIMWVMGYRISDKYKVTDNTENILKVEIVEIKKNKLEKKD